METRRYHVLYIEDHDDTRELVELVLAERNYRVTTGSTIADALKLAHQHHFDLYILDSWLPDGSGIDLCKSLREFHPRIPILFLSGAAYEADKDSALKSGAQGYLIKPADLDVLCWEVSKVIDSFTPKRQRVAVPPQCSSYLRGASGGNTSFEFSSSFKYSTVKH